MAPKPSGRASALRAKPGSGGVSDCLRSPLQIGMFVLAGVAIAAAVTFGVLYFTRKKCTKTVCTPAPYHPCTPAPVVYRHSDPFVIKVTDASTNIPLGYLRYVGGGGYELMRDTATALRQVFNGKQTQTDDIDPYGSDGWWSIVWAQELNSGWAIGPRSWAISASTTTYGGPTERWFAHPSTTALHFFGDITSPPLPEINVATTVQAVYACRTSYTNLAGTSITTSTNGAAVAQCSTTLRMQSNVTQWSADGQYIRAATPKTLSMVKGMLINGTYYPDKYEFTFIDDTTSPGEDVGTKINVRLTRVPVEDSELAMNHIKNLPPIAAGQVST